MRAGAWIAVILVASGCMVRGSAQTGLGLGSGGSEQPPAEAGSAPVEPGAAMSGPIEAGCSFNGGQLEGELGSEFAISCPDGCATQGGTWGSEFYTIDSPICRAGIHAGAIPATGGTVHVRIERGRPAYRGSARNGIESWDYGAYHKSFAVLNAKAAPVAKRAAGPQVIEAGCSYSGSQVVGEVGTRVTVACPAGCVGKGGAWGSDVYTIDSSVCLAGVHAGIITDDGGQVGVTIEPGRPAYRGSTRNGVESYDYGAYRSSFKVTRP